MKQWLYIIGIIFSFSWNNLSAQELQVFLEKGLENNPTIKIFELRNEQTKEKKNEVFTLPNTEFGLGVFTSTPETRTGAQKFKISVKQMLPWFGTIRSREKYASSLEWISYQDLLVARRKLILSISDVYYTLSENIAKQEIIARNIALLKVYKKQALQSVEVNKSSAIDILKLNIKQNSLQQQKVALEAGFQTSSTKMNTLLNRDIDTPIWIEKALPVPVVSDSISKKKLALHPELVKYDKLYSSIVELDAVYKKQRNPSIGFGLDYIQVEKRPTMDFSDNGKDIVMPMLSVSVPIFNAKNNSLRIQNKLKQEEIISEKQLKLNTLEVKLQQAISYQKTEISNYKTATKNLKQSQKVKEILLKSYETGSVTFIDILDIQETLLQYELQVISAVANYYKQSLRIQYFIQ